MATSPSASDSAFFQRMEAMEAQLQFQAGALADSREQHARQHAELLKMMTDLSDTSSHTRTIAAEVQGAGTSATASSQRTSRPPREQSLEAQQAAALAAAAVAAAAAAATRPS